MDHFARKEQLKARAVEHTKNMEAKFHGEIKNSIWQSTIYGGDGKVPTKKVSTCTPAFTFANTDTVTAILQNNETDKRVAVLNFASYKNPGGMFIGGSFAQEESLCHESFLYNVLRDFPQYYEYNSRRKNRALYTDRAIYSPDIHFERKNENTVCDVITCACPNKGAAKRWCNVTDEENSRVLRERIQFVKNIAEDQKVDVLIAGAFGCGVFRQDPEEVAATFKDVFSTSTVGKVIMVVPGSDINARVFERYFGR